MSLYQPEPTDASPNSRSRLDRVCSNQYDTEYFDKSFSCTTLHWCPALSRHRPLSMRKCLPEAIADVERPICDQVLDYPAWPQQVSLAWHSIFRDRHGASAISKLEVLKEARRLAERALSVRAGRRRKPRPSRTASASP